MLVRQTDLEFAHELLCLHKEFVHSLREGMNGDDIIELLTNVIKDSGRSVQLLHLIQTLSIFKYLLDIFSQGSGQRMETVGVINKFIKHFENEVNGIHFEAAPPEVTVNGKRLYPQTKRVDAYEWVLTTKDKTMLQKLKESKILTPNDAQNYFLKETISNEDQGDFFRFTLELFKDEIEVFHLKRIGAIALKQNCFHCLEILCDVFQLELGYIKPVSSDVVTSIIKNDGVDCLSKLLSNDLLDSSVDNTFMLQCSLNNDKAKVLLFLLHQWNLSVKDLLKIWGEAIVDGRLSVVEMMHDKYGFGPKELKENEYLWLRTAAENMHKDVVQAIRTWFEAGDIGFPEQTFQYCQDMLSRILNKGDTNDSTDTQGSFLHSMLSQMCK